MSGNIIDSLFISLGLDTAAVQKGIQSVATYISSANVVVKEFASGFEDGFQKGATNAHDLATATKEAEKSLQDAGKKGVKSIESIATQVKKSTKEVKSFKEEARKLGQSIGASLKGVFTSIAAPVAGLFAAGAIMTDYFSDLKTLDELSRKTSLSMEERASKQKLLSKYTKEDLKQYRESNKAMDDFKDTLSKAFLPIMRTIVPALTWFLKSLGSVVDFVKAHKTFFIPFFAGIAAVLLGVLVPALISTKIAGWGAIAPFLPLIRTIAALIAIVTAVSLVIDSFLVYLAGGESALAGFFSLFGTGEEISQALATAWKDLKTIGQNLWNSLVTYAKKFFSYFEGIIEPFKNLFKNALELIKALFTGNFQEAWESFKGIWSSLGSLLVSIASGALDLVVDLFKSAGSYCYDGFTSALSYLKDFIASCIPQWLKDLLGIDGGKGATAVIGEALSGLEDKFNDMLPSFEGITNKLQDAQNAIKDFGSGIASKIGGLFSWGSTASVSPTLSRTSTVDNSSRSTTSINKVVIETKSSDPKEIRAALDNRNLVSTYNFGVNQKGGR